MAQAISSAALFSVVLLVSSLDPALASQRCMVTDPTGTPLNVRRFDGRVIGALHNGEIVKVLRTGADSKGKPWAMSVRNQRRRLGLPRVHQLLLMVTRAPAPMSAALSARA